MDKGYYHPERGYWQTIGEPSEDILAGYPAGTIQTPLKPGPGYTWDGVQWQPPAAEDPVTATVPRVVTMRQARLALLSAGLYEQVDDAINALPEPPRTAARIEWDYSSEVHRDKPFVQMLAGALGLTGEQLDALFIQAAGL